MEVLPLRFSHTSIFNNLHVPITSKQIILLEGKNASGKTSLLKLLSQSNSMRTWIKFETQEEEFIRSSKACALDYELGPNWLSLKNFITCYKHVFSTVQNDAFWNFLNEMELNDLMNTSMKQLSSGSKRKVVNALCLFSSHRYILIDEPFENLDAESISYTAKQIINHVGKKKNFIISTHVVPSEIKSNEYYSVRL